MTELVDLQIGARIAGRYEIIEEIGRGGFGVVYRAIQENVNRSVALKTLRKNVALIPGYDFADAFRREALHTSQLRHPNTITLFDYGETDDGMLFLVTELLEGETLYERMWREQVLSVELTVHIAKQIAKSLAEAHNIGIIHGDLKPANIFLVELYGEKDFVKVLDFGIAKIIGEVDPAGMGTPEYMSPEQFSGQPLLAASDIYSLGVIMYEMVMGHRPFDDEDTAKLARKQLLQPLPPMSPEVEQSPLGYVIRRATQKEPANRYRDGLALVEALNNLGKRSPSQDRIKARADDELHRPVSEPTAPSAPALDIAEAKPHREMPEDPRSSAEALESRPVADSWVRSDNPPLHGRASDRTWLLEQVASAAAGKGRIILMGGAAGVGKTRLSRWLVHEAELPEGVVGGSGEHREGSPLMLEGLSAALGDALGLPSASESDYDPEQATEVVDSLLDRSLTANDKKALKSLFGQTFSVDDIEVDVKPVAQLVSDVARARPMVLHLDNIQSAKSNTLAFLEALAERLDGGSTPLLVLLTVRREALPAVPELANRLLSLVGRSQSVIPRSLVAMSPEDSIELAAAALAAEAEARAKPGVVNPEITERIATRAHGNPLYVLQLVTHLADSDAIESVAGTIELKEGAAIEGMIPPKIGGLLRLRVAQLTHRHDKGKALEFLLLRVALLGDGTPRAVLAELLRLEGEAGEGLAGVVLTELNELVPIVTQEDLLVQQTRSTSSGRRETVLRFTQPLIYQILAERVARLPDITRLEVLAGRAKQRVYGQARELAEHFDEIGDHFRRAGNLHEAIGFFVRTARHSARAGQTWAACEMLDRVVSLTGDDARYRATMLRIQLAMAFGALIDGSTDEIRRFTRDADATASETSDEGSESEIALLEGFLAELGGDISAAERFEDALELFQDRPPGAPVPAEDATSPPFVLLLGLKPLPAAVGAALAQLGAGRTALANCRFRDADARLKAAKRNFEAADYKWGTGQALVALSELHLGVGDIDRARAMLERSLMVGPNDRTHLHLADLDRIRGDLVSARESVDRVLASPSLERRGRLRNQALLHQGLVYARLGDPATAEVYEDAVSGFRDLGDHVGLFLALMCYGGFLAASGDLERAEQMLAEALTLSAEGQFQLHIPRLQLVLGAISDRTGRLTEARDWYNRCIELAMLVGDRISLAEAHAQTAQLVRHKRSPVALPIAINHLDSAQRTAAELEATLDQVLHASEAVARAWLRTGANPKARPLLRAAMEGWRRLGNRTEFERLETLFAKVEAS